ncbi:MAG: ABC transporter permease [Proteobacteria bacterium]|jgi:putative ABC transport system permease protein|nr:ABC transporter permease [Pseudomonadota bacterium]
MNTIQIIGAIELGLIYGFVAMGVYLSLRILDFPDLSVDGTFPLGAATCAALIVAGVHPLVATIAAMILGGLAGLITAWLSTHLKFMNLLSGILVMTALYSINLRVMGRPNIPLLGENTLFEEFFLCLKGPLGLFWRIFPILIFIGLLAYLLNCFLKTNTGLALRATGNNARMARAQGINDKAMVSLGLCLANSFVALGGAIFAQVSGYADISMGVGTIIIGLAAVIIGEAVLPIRKISHAILACIAGAILYRFVIATALNIGGSLLQASDLNLVTAVLVGIAMLLPDLKRQLRTKA